MAYHPLHQIVGHRQAAAGPAPPPREEAPRRCCADGCGHGEQAGEPDAWRTEHGGRDHQLEPGDEREESAAERERFDRLRFNDATEQLPRAFVSDFLGLEPQGSVQAGVA